MKRFAVLSLGIVSLSFAASAQVSISALTSWSPNNDGWLAPGEGGYAYLSTASLERGIAYGNGHVYLVSRDSVGGSAINIRILDKATAADLGGLKTPGGTG